MLGRALVQLQRPVPRAPRWQAVLSRGVWKPAMLPGTAAASSDPATDRLEACTFIEERGYSPALAEAIVDALDSPEWGAGPSGRLALAKRLAGAWEVGHDAGLAALAAAVERSHAASEGKRLVSFIVNPARGAAFRCEAFEGQSLKEVAEHGEDEGARTLAEHLECACSGVMACSTCHVYIDEAWTPAVGEPTEEEEDMLDLAYERKGTSRLGCQLILTPELDGLVITLPDGANNLFDHIPFE